MSSSNILSARVNKHPGNFYVSYRAFRQNIIEKDGQLYFEKNTDDGQIFQFMLKKIDKKPRKFFLQALLLPFLFYFFIFLIGLKIIIMPLVFSKAYFASNYVYVSLSYVVFFAVPFLTFFNSSKKEIRIIFFAKYFLVLSLMILFLVLGIFYPSLLNSYRTVLISYSFILLGFIYWDERIESIIRDFKDSSLYSIVNNSDYFINWDKDVFYILINFKHNQDAAESIKKIKGFNYDINK